MATCPRCTCPASPKLFNYPSQGPWAHATKKASREAGLFVGRYLCPMLSSREQLLGRIRTALAAGPATAPPVPDWGAPVHPPLPHADLAVLFA